MHSKDPHALLGLRDERGFACCFVLASPAVRHVSKLELIQSGILMLAWHFGFDSMKRVSNVLDFCDRLENVTIKNANQTWQVQRMVIQ